MSSRGGGTVLLCNGATATGSAGRRTMSLEYRPTAPSRNVSLSLPGFSGTVFHLPDRTLDLLELAAYVFAADRMVRRGTRRQLEYRAWARSLHFVMRVRDAAFWSSPAVQDALVEALLFMSGDQDYSFSFEPGHETPPASLFDSPQFARSARGDTQVLLFSGGLDSLAGAVAALEESDQRDVCLVSHVSGQPGVARTQRMLARALATAYPKRVHHYPFTAGLSRVTSSEETQRTRAFLYTAIAYALASAMGEHRFFVYENGMTALNFASREDVFAARASRTAHPKTIALLAKLFSLLAGDPISIETPFLFMTKADVFRAVHKAGKASLISSSVSCSQTFQVQGPAPNCGACSQCIERRFASYAAGLEQADEGEGIYSTDIVTETNDPAVQGRLIDYVRQARDLASTSLDKFYYDRALDLADVVEHLPGYPPENEAVESVWDLCTKHGREVVGALERMRNAKDDLMSRPAAGSLLALLASREYLLPAAQVLAAELSRRLGRAIPTLYQTNRPANEKELNDAVEAILNADRPEIEREHPTVRFGLAKAVPDHSRYGLFVECKYIRGGTSPSKVTEAMAADITKYRPNYVLFLVYDPERAIHDDQLFMSSIEDTGPCTVSVIR